MRILISNDTFYPDLNGAAYAAYRLAKTLMQYGHTVLVIAPSLTYYSEMNERGGVQVFGVRSLPFKHYAGFRFSLPFFVKGVIRQAVQEFEPDIIHIQGHFVMGRTLVKVANELNIPIMGTNHFMPENLVFYLHLPAKIEEWVKRKAWNDFRRIFERLHTVTTPTKTAANLVEKYGFSKPILPVSNGIDLKRFYPGADDHHLKERYKLPSRPILLFVGRLDKEKNVDMVLRALAEVDPKIAPHFLIAGKGYEQERLKNLAKELGLESKVTFAGFVPDDDLPSLYRAADAFIIAGIAELQSLVTMEAMATGLPVLGIDAMALPELVHDGENGFLFPVGNIKKLSHDISKLFSDSDLRRRMGEKSLEIIQNHSLDKVMATFEALYQKLLDEGRRA